MAQSNDSGCATLLAVAAIAFFVGRASVSDKEPKVDLPATTAQQFLAAPEPEQAPPPETEPVYSPPQRFSEPSVYFPNCSAARAAGVAPVQECEPGYASHLDRDGDGVGCE